MNPMISIVGGEMAARRPERRFAFAMITGARRSQSCSSHRSSTSNSVRSSPSGSLDALTQKKTVASQSDQRSGPSAATSAPANILAPVDRK